MSKLREKAADVQHAIWADWIRWEYSVKNCITNPDGSITIPAELVQQRTRNALLEYEDLTEDLKGQDREQADRVLRALGIEDC